MNAIDDADEATFRAVKDARNLFAHELAAVLGGRKLPDFDRLFPKLIELLIKIERWWIINVEMETDPDLAARVTNPQAVMPMSWMFLQVMERVALGKEDEAWELYRMFQQETAAGVD